MRLKTYYFTMGTEGTPFEGGWIEVTVDECTDSRAKAIRAYRAYYPDRTEGIVNCADIYEEEKFWETKMYSKGNFGKRTQKEIYMFSKGEKK